MTALLAVLCLAQVQDKDLEKARLFVYDAGKGIKLRIGRDGKVELSVTAEDKEAKTYSADSVEEFRKKYSAVVKKHDLERYFSPPGTKEEEFTKWWEELKKQRRWVPDVPDLDEDMRKWMEDQWKSFDELRKRFRGPGDEPEAPGLVPAQGGGREFGLRIDSVSETLRDQLSLEEEEGVVISEVVAGSLAEKSGLKAHDVILNLNGKAVTGKWQFRQDVREALSKPSFELEILRGGKKQTVKVKTGPAKDE